MLSIVELMFETRRRNGESPELGKRSASAMVKLYFI
jgi:hypothetical protein